MFYGLEMINKLKFLFTRLFSDELLRHTGILFSGMMVVHVCNMVFQMAVSRALPKEEYALLAAFLGVLAIIQRPLGTLTTGITHYSSLMRQEGRIGDVRRLLRKWLLLAGGAGLFLGIVGIASNQGLTGFFHLDRAAPVVVASVLLPVLFCSPVLMGASQGLQLFRMGLVAGVIGALARLGLGAGLVWAWVPACGWAMLGHGVGAYVTAGLLLVGLVLAVRRKKESDAPLPRMRFYLLQSFLVQTACAVLMTADVILVKHYIPEDLDFAYAATLGRIIVFLPGAIVVAMFPKVASRGAGTCEQYRVFLKSIGMTALFVVASVAGCLLLPGLLAHILFGITDASVYLKQMIGAMAFVMGLFALLNVVVQFLLAQRRFGLVYSTIGGALLYLGAVFFVHSSTWCIVGAAGGGIVLALVVMLVFLHFNRFEVEDEES